MKSNKSLVCGICRDPRILSLIHPLEENTETMAYATEPVLGSLANAIGNAFFKTICYVITHTLLTGYLEERLQQNVRSSVRHYSFLEFEVKYGLLQVN